MKPDPDTQSNERKVTLSDGTIMPDKSLVGDGIWNQQPVPTQSDKPCDNFENTLGFNLLTKCVHCGFGENAHAQSDKTVEELLKNFHQETIAFANEEIDALDMNKVLNYTKQALTARENRMVQEAVKAAVLPIAEAAMTIEHTDDLETVLLKYHEVVKAIRVQTNQLVAQRNHDK